MTKFSQLSQILYKQNSIPSGKNRRELMIEEMQKLNSQKIHCFNCTGTCCTYSANSMQITPIEAFEIILSLEVTIENLLEIKTRLQQNIKDYRLDHEIFLGKKNISHLRKTYTCPFFTPGSKGCTIKKDLKPYGCLGFNPRIENDNGGLCTSNTEILEVRESQFRDHELWANNYLKKEFCLDWEKCEIPKAVLLLLEKMF
jgi:hypothetical protein